MKITLFLCALSLAFALFGSGAYQMSASEPRIERPFFWAATYFTLAGFSLGLGTALLVLL